MHDTGMNIPETLSTLKEQQKQLIAGLRIAQMFPVKSQEITLPEGFKRVVTDRGVFHFNPDLVTEKEVVNLNEIAKEECMNLVVGGEGFAIDRTLMASKARQLKLTTDEDLIFSTQKFFYSGAVTMKP